MDTAILPEIPTRRPVAAGRFYPAVPEHLHNEIMHYVNQGDVCARTSPRALIVPHAGYGCSGTIAGHAFAALASTPAKAYTVFLMGPAHWVAVNGIALSRLPGWATPLGMVPVNMAAVSDLLARGHPFHVREDAHRPEHALEVELPFLQAVLARFAIVPLLLQDARWAEELSIALDQVLDHHQPALVVVSSDLSHYHPYRKACARDGAFLHALAAGDIDAARRGEACGLPAILALLMVANRRGWTGRLLAYANSGDTCSDHRAVVGYGAIAFTAESSALNARN